MGAAVIRRIKALGIAAKRHLLDGSSREIALLRATSEVLEDTPTRSKKHLMWTPGGTSLGLAWLESGFPTISVGSRLAASLMCTSLPKEHLGDVRPPWRCFSIQVPKGLLGDAAREVVVLFPRPEEDRHERSEPSIQVFQFIEGIPAYYGREPSLVDWADLDLEKGADNFSVQDGVINGRGSWVSSGWTSTPIGHESRVAVLVGRLIVGLCIEFDTPHLRDCIARGPKNQQGFNRRGEPTSWTFTLGRPTRADLTEAVRAYVGGSGTSGKLKIQHMVRGHRKRQVCGPDGTERQWIHVEPYWRGDPDAPIAVRPHLAGVRV